MRLGWIAVATLVLVSGGWWIIASEFAVPAPEQAARAPLRQLAAYRAALASRPALEAERDRVSAKSSSVAGLVPGETAALAAANIQNMVKAIVSSNGGDIRSSQALPASTTDGFEKIEVSYDIALPEDRLKDLAYQLETHTPYLFLDNVAIQMPQLRLPQSSDNPVAKLEIHWTVRAYRWAGAP
jgi:hypothetical protein